MNVNFDPIFYTNLGQPKGEPTHETNYKFENLKPKEVLNYFMIDMKNTDKIYDSS